MNWGYKLITAGGLFIGFILIMSFYMLSRRDADGLVDEDYYEAGMQFDRKLEAQQNTLREHVKPAISLGKNLILIRLKDTASYELTLQRPSDKRQDKKMTGRTAGGNLIVVDRSAMQAGAWQLELSWKTAGRTYNYTQKLML